MKVVHICVVVKLVGNEVNIAPDEVCNHERDDQKPEKVVKVHYKVFMLNFIIVGVLLLGCF